MTTADLVSYRAVKLARHPKSELRAEDFSVAEERMSEPRLGEAVVRNRWFRVSVSARLMASEDAEDIKGIPFPPIRLGDTLADGAIGEVVRVGPGCDLAVGSMVMHPLGWREYAVVEAGQCSVLDGNQIDPAAWLGHGWTAYAALTQGVDVRNGDTVFVSSGAGAIGSMAGQIARRLGAKRVIGSTSTEGKAHWMRTELGYDAVVTRAGGTLRDQLASAAPEGIDVVVDMVGGDQLATAVSLANEGARCVLLGALSAELDASKATLRAPVELDTFQIILKGISLRGFSACENSPQAFGMWMQQLASWQHEGGIHIPCTTFRGIEQAPFALQEACAGRLKGLVLVEL